MTDEQRREQDRRLEQQAREVGAMMTMVSIGALMPGEHWIHCYAAPWDCLTVAKQFHDAGANYISLHPWRGPDWSWLRPRKSVKSRRGRAPQVSP